MKEGSDDKKVQPQSLGDVVKVMDMQVRRDIDLPRARAYWLKTLSQMPAEVLAEALSSALATGRYQEAPRRCSGCCQPR